MITILSPEEQLKYLPMSKEISDELSRREVDKLRVINKVPFLRVSCLQKLTFTDGSPEDGKKQNLSEVKNKIGVSDSTNSTITTIDGFIFELNSSFEESYSERQVIGTELSSLKKLYVKNPRRVPPPYIESFTATIGEEAGFYTTGTLKFTVNSKEQLEFITPFLLHPGNTVIFEFGYSDKNTTMKESLFTNSDVEDFLSDIVIKKNEQIQRRESNDSSFFRRLQQKILQTNGNYEYLVGVVNNFDISLNDDFGFDVTVDVWSISKTIVSSKNSGNYEQKDSPRADISTILINREQDAVKYVLDIEKGLERAVIQEMPRNIKVVGKDNNSSSYVISNAVTSPGRVTEITREFQEDRNSVITVESKKGDKKYITLDKIISFLQLKSTEIKYKTDRLVKINPYIISHDDSCIIFRKNQPTLSNVKVNTDTYHISFNINDINFIPVLNTVISINKIKIETSEQRLRRQFDENNRRNSFLSGGTESVVTATQNKKTINFPTKFKPYIFDDEENPNLGHIGRIYYDANLFLNHYKNYGGKPIDVLRNILNDINYATKNIFELKLLETFDLTDPNGKSNNIIESFSSRIVEPQDRKNTYTFKFNQKESIVTSLTFDLGLEGLVADQIYFESINQPNNSIESSKLNLLLFEKHEKNILLQDKRNIRIQQEYEKQKEQGGNDTVSDTKPANDTTFQKLYQSDPSEYILSLTVPSVESTTFIIDTILDNMTDDTDEKDLNILSIVEKVPEVGNIIPLIDKHSEPYFQAMKEIGYIESKTGNLNVKEQEKSLGGISPLLESRLTISLPGIGGIQPLQFFNTDGLPDVYDKRGDFCIMSVTQTITPTDWTTSLSAAFRVRRDDE